VNKLSTIILAAAATVLTLSGLSGCKTTEENYRAAYEKTIAARAENSELDSTIYGAVRRQSKLTAQQTSQGTVNVTTQLVRVTAEGGGIAENLHRYNVVVGQFKQLFNASSMRDRIVDGGYPTAFVVETAEPYYYVVLMSFNKLEAAASALKDFSEKPCVTMKEPCPFILDATAHRHSTKNNKR